MIEIIVLVGGKPALLANRQAIDSPEATLCERKLAKIDKSQATASSISEANP